MLSSEKLFAKLYFTYFLTKIEKQNGCHKIQKCQYFLSVRQHLEYICGQNVFVLFDFWNYWQLWTKPNYHRTYYVYHQQDFIFSYISQWAQPPNLSYWYQLEGLNAMPLFEYYDIPILFSDMIHILKVQHSAKKLLTINVIEKITKICNHKVALFS